MQLIIFQSDNVNIRDHSGDLCLDGQIMMLSK
jgi:hypothetical protein